MHSLPTGQNRPTPETQPYETRLSTFKVNELQTLLQAFKVQKIGKKNELYTRCVEILRTPTMTRTVIDKIREIEARVNQRVQPYPTPSISQYHQQQQQNMYRQNGMSYNAFGGLGAGGMMGGMNMHQNINSNASMMSNVQPRPARDLTAMPLPFYDPIHTLLEAQELPVACHPTQKMNAQVTCQFSLSTEHHMKLSVQENVFPRTEVQLRFFNTTGDILNIEQADDFPLNCSVRINDQPVSLPNVIPTNKPNVEPKRPSRPVNITPYVINKTRDNQHRMRVDWQADKRRWAFAVYLVTRVNADILRTRIVNSPSFELPYETTEATIRKRLGGGDDDDVAMDSLKISLLCPLMKTRMGIAARSRDCTHLQCFDLDSYLMLNEKKPAWKCGVCNNAAPYHKLIIDKYFMKMLKELGPAVTDVELLKDGSYRVVKEDECCDLSDDDGDDVKPTKKVAVVASGSSAGGSRPSSTVGAAGGGGGTGPPPAKKAAIADDVITLSDDDEVDLRQAIRASMPSTATGPPLRTPIKKQNSPSSDDSIIVLDDTPPRAEKNSAPSSSSASGGPASATSWRSLSSTGGSASSSAAPTPTSSSAAAAAPTSSAAASSSSSYGQQRPATLHDALNQAGLRAGMPAQLQLNGAPLSAATMAGQQNVYNWQQPQSAPPMMQPQQQQQQNQWNSYMQQHYAQQGFYNMYDPRQQQNGYPGNLWAPPNGQPVYPPQGGGQGGGGVIRRHDDQSR